MGALILSSASAQTSAPAQPPETQPAASQPAKLSPLAGFLFRQLEFDGRPFSYCVYVPPEYDPAQAWPVVLFLHGSGERGSDGFLQSEVGIAHAIRRNRALCPAIVVMPQCPAGQRWFGPMIELAVRCLEQTSLEFRLDQERLYLTGLSMGGEGAWLLGQQYAKHFAAIVPICGFIGRPDVSPDPVAVRAMAENLRGVPIWAFHGEADDVVPAQRTVEIVQVLQAVGGNVRYTPFPNVNHNAWDRVYGDEKFWSWLLAQRRASQPPASQP